MSAQKTIRESRKLLEPLGYELVGWNQNSHLVYRHASTGAIARVVNGFDATRRGKANMVLQARRSIREVESVSRLWLNFVREQYEVGIDEEKLCVISMVSLVKRFRARYPELRFSDKLPGVAFRQSPYVDHVKTGVYLVRGELFGVNPPAPEETVDVPVPEPVREPDPAPVVAASGGAADAADGGVEPVSEADGAEPLDDPVVAESDRAERGLILTDALAAQLRDALGVDGDLEAENALLRETLTKMREGLQMLSEHVQTALSLHGPKRPAVETQRLGPKRTRQLHALQAARGSMPEQFTADDVESILGVGHDEALNVLAGFAVNGHVVRLARGVYRWADR